METAYVLNGKAIRLISEEDDAYAKRYRFCDINNFPLDKCIEIRDRLSTMLSTANNILDSFDSKFYISYDYDVLLSDSLLSTTVNNRYRSILDNIKEKGCTSEEFNSCSELISSTFNVYNAYSKLSFRIFYLNRKKDLSKYIVGDFIHFSNTLKKDFNVKKLGDIEFNKTIFRTIFNKPHPYYNPKCLNFSYKEFIRIIKKLDNCSDLSNLSSDYLCKALHYIASYLMIEGSAIKSPIKYMDIYIVFSACYEYLIEDISNKDAKIKNKM